MIKVIAVAMLSFLVCGMTFAASPLRSYTKDADAIRETVFRYQIQHDISQDKQIFRQKQGFSQDEASKQRQLPPDTTLRFLAVNHMDGWRKVSGNWQQTGSFDYHDPSRNVMKLLVKQFPLVRSYSYMKTAVRKHRARYRANVEIGIGIFYWTAKLHWLNRDTVEIEAGSKGNAGGDSDMGSYVEDSYRVVKHGHRWVVQSVEQIAAAG